MRPGESIEYYDLSEYPRLMHLFRCGFLPHDGTVAFYFCDFQMMMDGFVFLDANWPREFWGTP